jgi:hypothetical protein
MTRTVVSIISAVVFLAASMPQVSAVADQSQQEIRSLLQAMPAGTAVEIVLGQNKATGRIKRVTEERLVLEQGTKTMEYFISEISSVKKRLLGGSDLELSPGALGAVVVNEKIKAMTRDGGYVEGKVLQASEDILVIDVSSAEPKGRFRGQSTISTVDIAVVYMKRNGSVAAPVALGVIGGFLALIGSTYAAYETNSGPLGAFLIIGGTSAGAAAGAYGGREAVKKTLTITVTR